MRSLSMWCHSLLLVAVVMMLAACEGGGGSGSSDSSHRPLIDDPPASSVTSLSGQVADGYLRGARVFLDRNGNRVYDSGEPMTLSGERGTFTLSTNPGEGAYTSVVVEILAGETVDEDSGQPVSDGYLLESPPGYWSFVSPLTTLVNLELNKNPTMTVARAELNIKNRLGIVDEVSVFDDYLMPEAQPAGLRQEYARTHKVAQVVAALMGRLRTDITHNLETPRIAADQQKLVAYLITDQILRHADTIRDALNEERNFSENVNISALTTEIEGALVTSELNQEMLDFYARRIEQKLEFWDMEPPRIQQQIPAGGAIVSIDAVVSLIFDKALEPGVALREGRISVRGPQGAVSGSLDYNQELRRLRFVPNQMLLPYSDYEVVVSGELTDTRGNRLGTDVVWQFSTIFDKTPPPLPNL